MFKLTWLEQCSESRVCHCLLLRPEFKPWIILIVVVWVVHHFLWLLLIEWLGTIRLHLLIGPHTHAIHDVLRTCVQILT